MRFPRRTIKVMLVSLLIWVLFWVADSFFQFFMYRSNLRYLLFDEPLSLSKSLFGNIPPYALFTRVWFLFSCILAAIIIDLYLKRLEERDKALKTSINRYNILQENSRDAIVFVDAQGVIRDFNHSARAMLHSVLEEKAPQTESRDCGELNLKSLISPDGSSVLLEAMNRENSHETSTFEDTLNLPAGPVPIEILVNPLHSDLGLSLVLIRDITRRKAADEERVKAAKLESLGVLAGGIAHDFNNQLTALTANISVALHSLSRDTCLCKVDEKGEHLVLDNSTRDTRNLLREALNACRRASGLTRQLLTFAKGGSPVLKRTHVYETLRETMVFAMRGKPVGYEIVIQDDLWEVNADLNQISQVINNLVINSIQAMGNTGKVRLRARNVNLSPEFDCPFNACDKLPCGEYVAIIIEDSGPGIPEDIIDRLFDPYFTTKQTGSGLGLASSYSIARKHGGLLMARGNLPPEMGGLGGAAFLLMIPRVRLDEQSPLCGVTKYSDLGNAFPDHEVSSAIESVEPESQPAIPAPVPIDQPQAVPADAFPAIDYGSGRVLIMDDEDYIRTVVAKILTRLGYEPMVASRGEEAVEIFRREMEKGRPIDVTVVDLTIPGGMGGMEAAREIWKLDSTAKIIVSSGYSNDMVMSEHRKLGFAGVIAKPFDITTLSRQLKETLEAPSPADMDLA